MKKTNENLILCNMIFAVALVISNVTAGKLFYTGIQLFGTTVTLPGAVICYPVTFLMTDVIGEIWGKKEANNAVKRGFICQCVSSLIIVATQYIPALSAETQAAYTLLLGQSWIFFIGSMVAYYCSQSWDVWIFHKIRNKFNAEPSKRWLWNNGSTMTSQMIDTVIYITISFGFGFGWLLDREMWPTLAAMMVGQYVVKFLEAALDTPFFYLMTRRKDERACLQS